MILLDNVILGAEFHTVSAAETPFLIQQWVDNLNYRLSSAQTDEACYLAVNESHITFERIHPFSDGNGRTGRLLINYSLMQHDLPPVVTSSYKRTLYISYLAKEDGLGLSQFIQQESQVELDRIRRFQN
ncbi:Fic family protein [Sporolactobacillus shoreicorticis]|uniref:Fic family protein n=1 Tax=Sporolactobacillus shoreicorticis TaxID=1923877 RepID=A0ABW5S4P5_9BACL|nr:Fic family protein [Sporolactobacillus shoreicorticis]MCO7127378.1 Fic family protein [Sporolactobacillus shoreicorticis]